MSAAGQDILPRTRLGQGSSAALSALPDTEANSYMTFDLGAQIFAVDVAVVREILDVQEVAALPNASSNLIGMIDIRGQAIPVMDVSQVLGLPRRGGADQDERLVVLDFAGETASTVAIIADQVRRVVEIQPAAIDTVPAVPGRWNPGAMQGVTRLDGQLAYVIDLRVALDVAGGVPNLPGPFDFG